MTRTKACLSAILLLALGGGVVRAFPFNRSWNESATGVAGTNRAGGGGLYGTGGRTDKGVRCQHCHIKGTTPYGQIGATITPSPAFVKKNGEDAYVPGTHYTFTIAMTGEHRFGTMAAYNKNAMALTIENSVGMRAGRFVADAGQDTNACPSQNPYPGSPGPTSPVGKTTFMYGDCHGVLPLDLPQLTSWKFDWYAPAAGAGDLTLHLGMVDGDSDGESSLGDDALERSMLLREGP